MEDLVSACFGGIYSNRNVLVTGHTGFKGSWLCEWLLALGARVTGVALDPAQDQPLFEQLRMPERLESDLRLDVRDFGAVREAIAHSQPELLFHLAAQPLVRRSYQVPIETFATNVLGTAHVLDALRVSSRPCTVVVITTDKCYENREWLHSYREEDSLGGHDPYSASKACAELVTAAYQKSFFASTGIRMATARAGNVIGGGDWAEDRIVPDAIRALRQGRPVCVRNKASTRPWQHVLEPLSGYLWLGAVLHTARTEQGLCNTPLDALTSAFNFGPGWESNRPVAQLVEELLRHWPGCWTDAPDPNALHEAGRLNLATDKAFHLLGWTPVWKFSETVARTVEWYRLHFDVANAPDQVTRSQIEAYTEQAQSLSLPWATKAARDSRRKKALIAAGMSAN